MKEELKDLSSKSKVKQKNQYRNSLFSLMLRINLLHSLIYLEMKIQDQKFSSMFI